MTGGAEVKKKKRQRTGSEKKEKELGVFLCAWRLANSFSRKLNRKNDGTQREKGISHIGERARISLFHLVNSF